MLTLLLEAGDVIHLCHQHDSGCSACLSHWEIDAVVTENPAVVCDRVAVKWANTARQLVGGPAITGISVLYSPRVSTITTLPTTSRWPAIRK